VPKGNEGTYKILIGASGENLFSEKTVELKVTGAAAQAVISQRFEATSLQKKF
jgi:hypothetical protein